MALQALAEYAAATYSPEGATTVVVTSGGWRQDFRVDQQNRLLYQEQLLEQVPGAYRIRAKGEICVFVQVRLYPPPPPPPPFPLPPTNTPFSLSLPPSFYFCSYSQLLLSSSPLPSLLTVRVLCFS